MRCIDEIAPHDLKGKRVLVRSGLDLPLDANGRVADIFRLKRSCKTIEFLQKSGARVIVISKIGRDPNETNVPIAEAMKQFFPVFFVPDITGHVAHDAVKAMKDGEILLLENLQRDPREIAGDDTFAQELASLAELYVNDGFPSAHRESATMTGVPKFLPSYAGLLMREEVEQLNAALQPSSPSFAILGGAKFETKEPLIHVLLEKYDHLFIVGALANDVLKAKGFPVGVSLISKQLPGKDVLDHPKFLIPADVTVEGPDGQARVKAPQDVQERERIVDIGPDSIALIAPRIAEAKFILWSGPTGIYEKGYTAWTHAVVELLSHSNAQKVIGGGDTIAAIEKAGSTDNLGFLSTGGGAMLEYLANGTLPAIRALN